MSDKIFLPAEIARLDEGEEIYRRKLKKNWRRNTTAKSSRSKLTAANIFLATQRSKQL